MQRKNLTKFCVTQSFIHFDWLSTVWISSSFSNRNGWVSETNIIGWIVSYHNVQNVVSFVQNGLWPIVSSSSSSSKSIDICYVCDSCVSISSSRSVYLCLSPCLWFHDSSFGLVLFTVVNCRLLNQSSFDSNRTIILIFQFNDLCSQWEKWMKLFTKAASQQNSIYPLKASPLVLTDIYHIQFVATSIAKPRECVRSSWLFD